MTRRSFIELLDDEAPADEFYERLRLAERDCADEGELEVLRQEFAVAMRVRSRMAWQRQHESELRALYETANDLTALRDVDAVLSAIVRRARQLLAADVGYLSLIDDERGDCYIRTTDGSQSAAFPALRLPLGTGVLGMVMDNATPYATDNYLADTGIVHLGHVDTATTEEGILAVLGVPLLLNGSVMGALLVANRSPRTFSHDEVALLGSLGAHAAVALENARLFEEARSAVRDLNEVNAEVRAYTESLELAASAHDRLADVLLQGGGVADVARVLADVLTGQVWVLDPDGHELAVAGGACGPGIPPDSAIEEALQTGHATEITMAPNDVRAVAVARAGSQHLATVVLGRGTPLRELDRRILERTVVVTGLLLMFQRTVAEAEERVRGELLDDLLSDPHRDPDTFRERARRYRADLDAPHIVIVARAHGVERHRGAGAAAELVTEHHGLAGLRGDDVVLVVPGNDPLGTAGGIISRLRNAVGNDVTAGVAGPAVGPQSIAECYREAQQCLGALLSLDRPGEIADARALGFARFLLGRTEETEVDDYLSRVLGPVLAYDARRGTKLTATLDAWFAVGGSLGAVGSRLHVHANTVAQRLERVSALLGDEWRRPDRALDVQLALRIWRMRQDQNRRRQP
ncbi:sugar diacid utilization regulator [Prauserella shujinwangii]|uniref:Sugar diacid utilization regulator n=1 Tax=Prauserella shujinwangii TaxID=1453103 RepID=A0A2T0M0J5_9PSEU|nr:GAF domain-containing protein [Prauserella shujinwangii]PRX50112.1 sugar diacid utilization regulator [Prauserella shujinwangii]